MLSQKCQYAIRAVLYISIESNKEKGLKGGKEVSEALKIPLAFTGKILQQLAKSDVISSVKGPGGGFYLTEENLCLPIIQIVKTIDGLSSFNSCGLGLDKCSDEHPCPIHDTFKVGRDGLLELLTKNTIRELAKDIIKKELFLTR